MPDDIRWPLARNKIRRSLVSNTFGHGIRKDKNGKPRNHQGWDFYAAEGTECFAIGSGSIEFFKEAGDYGVQLCHSFTFKGKTYWAFYAHLKQGSVKWRKGQPISIGDKVGLTGNTGNAVNMKGDDQHLHFEIRTADPPGPGMSGRISPKKIYGICPLHHEVVVTEAAPILFNQGIMKLLHLPPA